MTGQKYHRLVGMLLGLAGVANALLMGFYLVATSLALLSLPRTEHLLFYAYLATILTAISAFLLTYGSYLLWSGCMRKGGVVNLAAGSLFVLLYLYFAFISQPRFLNWLWPFGCFLSFPAIMSGAIGVLTKKERLARANDLKTEC